MAPSASSGAGRVRRKRKTAVMDGAGKENCAPAVNRSVQQPAASRVRLTVEDAKQKIDAIMSAQNAQ